MLLLFLACSSPPPTFIDKAGIDKEIPRANTVAICAGMAMKDAGTRGYAAEKIATWKPAQDCACDHLQRDGSWDGPVLRGLKQATDDKTAGCVAALLDQPALPDRAALVSTIASMKVPMVQARLAVAAKTDADPAVRAAAMVALRPDKDAAARELVISALADGNALVRAGAAKALSGVDEAASALSGATKDSDPGVRAAALVSLKAIESFAFADVACSLLSTDPDATVRATAAATMQGTRDQTMFTCLGTHMATKEESGEVRMAMLTTLRKSTSQASSDILCDAIPFWTRTYVGDGPVDRDSDIDIVGAQNARDFNRSYECVEKAWKAGSYSCWQKGYLADYYRDLGGKVGVPKCGGGTRISNEVSF